MRQHLPPPPAPDAHAALRAAMHALSPLPDAEWAFFSSHVRDRSFAIGDFLFRERAPAIDAHFIVHGLVRIYQSGDGTEFVRGFDFENRFVAMYGALLTGDPSHLNVQALEQVRTLSFPASLLHQLYDRHACWERFGRRMLEQKLLQWQDKESRFRTLTPEAHYRLLVTRQSPLLGRVPLHQLAAYLQITPETLSRIRARVHRAAAPVPDAARRRVAAPAT